MRRIKIITAPEIALLLLVAAYTAICWRIATSYGLGDHFSAFFYLENCVVFTLGLGVVYLAYLALRAYAIMLFIRPPNLAEVLWADLKSGPLNLKRLSHAIPVFFTFIIFLSVFSSMKGMIPGINPYAWDRPLAALDHLIHFGTAPWRWLQPVLGHPFITWALSMNYSLWVPAMFAVLYWQLFSLRDPTTRMQFFLTFALTWAINGTFLAILFSSAGPCYFQAVAGSDYYLPLMDYLKSVHQDWPIYALTTQAKLWETIEDPLTMMGGGISAMPSIHVGTAFLFLLLARELKLKIWPVFAVFYAMILLGSVHLGWHYAVDGYLATLITFALWSLTGFALKRSFVKT